MAYLVLGILVTLGTAVFFWFCLPGPDGQMRPFLANKAADTYAAIAVTMGFPLGIGMRKGEAKLQKWINDWIQANTANGKLAAIHKKFHG